ncbi:MAG TPA: SGNH/GDSL hydrolase family protein, partial [Opitutaceae bacterium]|nr:SGNH/GDSL hydrolase family protein [Opitutaceae bacterium]
MLTTHPGSRTTSYLATETDSDTFRQAAARKIVHWYFLSGLEVETERPTAAIVVLGDSITDGYGTTTDGNDRWTDVLARRLQEQGPGNRIAVLNQGIGGNRLLRDGLGPNILARFDRDVIAQSGARWVIVLAGINDIGTRLSAREKGEPYASAADIIHALSQIIVRAHAKDMIVIGGTLTPYAGAGFYWSEDGEADRQTVNQWIRTSGQFDAVIDFDAALRDPENPTRLASAFDSGDHLHPSLAGYAEMARVVDLRHFLLISDARH